MLVNAISLTWGLLAPKGGSCGTPDVLLNSFIVYANAVARGWLARRKLLALRKKLKEETQKALELKCLEDGRHKALELRQKALELTQLKEERRKAQQERGFLTMKDASQNISTLEVESVMKELVGRTAEVYIYNCCNFFCNCRL